MLPTFLAQFAAGCLLVVAACDIRRSNWLYLRLMGVVSLALTILAGVFLVRAMADRPDRLEWVGLIGLGGGMAFGAAWLWLNAAQRERVTGAQRFWPAAAGASAMTAAAALALRPDALIGAAASPIHAQGLIAVDAVLGALVLGGVTAGMLLGHRYLTDTDMTIAPLRRLAHIYLVCLAVRIVWSVAMSWPIWRSDFQPAGERLMFWVALTARGAVGLAGAAIFAWMMWDCVKRRATQSATAIFYLSMILVFIGELAAQYLARSEGLAV